MALQIVVTAEGLQPTDPATIRSNLITLVESQQPGYSANLPGSLVEDISSTDVAAIAACDAALVETVNSLTPYGANAFLLNQLGQIYGVQVGLATNTSVYVQFTGPVGFVIAQGFTVSDGVYQYTVSDGGVIGSSGMSPLLFALATVAGSWPVLANTVSQLITSVPAPINQPGGPTLTVTNPSAGTAGVAAETEESYRSRVLQAGLAASQGMASYLKTLLGQVSGVQTRLISVRQQASGWEVIVGGGDAYQVADAIYTALFDISSLQASVISVTGVTQANPGVFTTDLNHGFAGGETATITGANPSNYDVSGTVTVIDEKNFSLGVDTTAFPAYVGSGQVSPNNRNIVVSLLDYPDTYNVTFVNPPAQTVTMTVTWNTTATNFISTASVQQLGSAALADYVNAIPVGAPINLFELQTTFQNAIASILDPALLTRMIFAVSINGVGVAPDTGTGIIAGDPESYFTTDSSKITITQG